MPITALPTPPSRQDPANFPARADAFHGALPTFATEATALEQNVNTKEASAVAKAAAAATSEGNALASKNATAASEANALAYKNSADASKTAAETAKDTSVAQAGLAAASAASAASVLQQDLSAVTTAALHRSPNAITAQFIYDTSKDSDGGAWTERCQHTSWFNEPLNGAWLGQHASEAAARAATGAATGAYFQLTTDGKFYKLLAGAGTAEVFRGNKAKFPRLAAIVAEAASVTIYDLTEAGRPMWLRVDIKASGVMVANSGGQVVTCVSMLNGTLLIGGTAATQYGWLFLFSFPADKVDVYDQQAVGHHTLLRGIDGRHAARSEVPATGALVSPLVNAVAMTVLPDAPIDVATGLPVPTIAAATVGGVSVIKQDGTVVNWTNNVPSTVYGAHIFFTKQGKVAWQDSADQTYWRAVPLSNFPSAGTTYYLKSSGAGDEFYAGDAIQAAIANPDLRFVPGTSEKLSILRLKRNPSKGAAGLTLGIRSDFNAGYLPGDIRRAYLANTEVESITAPELVPDGDFALGGSGWTMAAGWSVASGVLSSSGTSTYGPYVTSVAATVGKRYKVTFSLSGYTSGLVRVRCGGADSVAYAANGTYTTFLTADVASNSVFQLIAGTNFVGSIDNVSVKEAVADRSYKAAAANIFGTLTKTAVASAAQLVAYSGFSAANYLQEPYSADLDFGTGEWSASAWVNYSTAVAATIAERSAATGPSIKLGTDATGKLTATAYDGTTTRTVTSTAAYNTGTWTQASANYKTDGKLSISVNGVEVASATGAALLTLNNASAVLTIGNSRALDAPFPGSIALLKLGATVPTVEQSVWMYEQEKQMFRDGAQVTLPDSGAIVDLAYDEAQDKWVAVSAANESSWTGLVRTASAPVSAGAITKVAAQSGVKLLARSTTTPGVDVSIPAYGLREELVKRAETAARIAKNVTVFDFDATTGQTDFVLPVGYTARAVLSAGALKREGATKDYTRLYDGFRETIRFGVAPGNAVWIQIHAVKE